MASEESPFVTLNPVHAELLTSVLKLTRYQQSQRLKSIDHCFKNTLGRLREDEVYTGDEVTSIVTALQDTVGNEVRMELQDANHTNGLLLQQLLTNAEQWHLTLSVPISELENREKLDMIKNFEEGKPQEKMSITVTQTQQIIPVQDLNVAAGLKSEIAKLQEENEGLGAKLMAAEQRRGAIEEELRIREKTAEEALEMMKQDLEAAREEMDKLKTGGDNGASTNTRNFDFEAVQKDIRRMSMELERSRGMAEEEAEKLRKDLELREDKLRQVQSALLLTEKELDKKFQATSAYGNMKKILTQKNSVIKTLRQKVIEAGGNPEGEKDDPVTCDDD